MGQEKTGGYMFTLNLSLRIPQRAVICILLVLLISWQVIPAAQ
jgi:hypothetical protein